MKVITLVYISHGPNVFLKLTNEATTPNKAMKPFRKQKKHMRSIVERLVNTMKEHTSTTHLKPKSVRMQVTILNKLLCVSSVISYQTNYYIYHYVIYFYLCYNLKLRFHRTWLMEHLRWIFCYKVVFKNSFISRVTG